MVASTSATAATAAVTAAVAEAAAFVITASACGGGWAGVLRPEAVAYVASGASLGSGGAAPHAGLGFPASLATPALPTAAFATTT